MEYPVLHKLFTPPYAYLIAGMVFLSIGAISTNSGRVWVRFHGWLYRSEEPKTFWWNVASYSMIGAGFIGYFVFLGTTVGYPPLW